VDRRPKERRLALGERRKRTRHADSAFGRWV
jgi:hypothetical protein